MNRIKEGNVGDVPKFGVLEDWFCYRIRRDSRVEVPDSSIKTGLEMVIF
jgi:hypothetical protein